MLLNIFALPCNTFETIFRSFFIFTWLKKSASGYTVMMLTSRCRSDGWNSEFVSGGHDKWKGSLLAGAEVGKGCFGEGGAGKLSGDGAAAEEGEGLGGSEGVTTLAAAAEAPHVEPKRDPSDAKSRFTSVTDFLSVLHFLSASETASNSCLREAI